MCLSSLILLVSAVAYYLFTLQQYVTDSRYKLARKVLMYKRGLLQNKVLLHFS
jgi:hypothetical protein